MADTLNNIPLPRGNWVDLYAATGITVGTQIAVENLTSKKVKLFAGATPPADAEEDDSTGSFSRLIEYSQKVNQDGDAGAWAYAETTGALVSVMEFA